MAKRKKKPQQNTSNGGLDINELIKNNPDIELVTDDTPTENLEVVTEETPLPEHEEPHHEEIDPEDRERLESEIRDKDRMIRRRRWDFDEDNRRWEDDNRHRRWEEDERRRCWDEDNEKLSPEERDKAWRAEEEERRRFDDQDNREREDHYRHEDDIRRDIEEEERRLDDLRRRLDDINRHEEEQHQEPPHEEEHHEEENHNDDNHEEENKESEEEKNTVYINTATPFNIAFNKRNDKLIATIVFLCRDKDDKLIAVDRNIIVTEEEKDLLSCISFAEDPELDFASKKICNNMIITYLDNYVTEMKFTLKDNFATDENPMVYLEAKKSVKGTKDAEDYTLKMSPETFVCMMFVDSYIYEAKEDFIENEHDLALASIAGSKIPESPVTFFVVDKVESVVSMAPAAIDFEKDEEKKGFFNRLFSGFKEEENPHSTTVGLVMRVSEYVSKEERNVASVLVPLDIGVELDPAKFRGNTIKSIEENYYGDADQYVSTFMINKATIYGIDKKYMIIRGKTKDKKVKVFLLDSSAQQELKNLIDAF